jgi:hypothetical protein
MPILLKLFHTIKREGILPNSLYKVSIALTPKPVNGTTKKRKKCTNLLVNTDAKTSIKALHTKFNNTFKKITHLGVQSNWFHSRDAKIVQHKPINVILYTTQNQG